MGSSLVWLAQYLLYEDSKDVSLSVCRGLGLAKKGKFASSELVLLCYAPAISAAHRASICHHGRRDLQITWTLLIPLMVSNNA